jgi:hypothetical protein
MLFEIRPPSAKPQFVSPDAVNLKISSIVASEPGRIRWRPGNYAMSKGWLRKRQTVMSPIVQLLRQDIG